MNEYRFLGVRALIHTDGKFVELKRFGQSIQLTDDDATTARLSRVPLLSAGAFGAIGFTEDELKRWANTSSQDKAPQDFLDKKQRAFDAMQSEVAALQQQPATPSVTQQEAQPNG